MVSKDTNTFVMYQILSFKQQTDYYELGVKYLADDNEDTSTFINNENFKIQLVPRGQRGSQGYTGYTGFQGYTGFRGYTGFQGYTGYTGFQGYTGYQGFQGYTGFQGDIVNWWNTYESNMKN